MFSFVCIVLRVVLAGTVMKNVPDSHDGLRLTMQVGNVAMGPMHHGSWLVSLQYRSRRVLDEFMTTTHNIASLYLYIIYKMIL